MNLENIILIGKTDTKKATILYDHLYEIPRIGKSTETKISENCQKLRRKENGK